MSVVITAFCLSESCLASESADAEEFIIEEVKFIGLQRTHPDVVRREMLLQSGDRFNSDLLEESLKRLRNMGPFATARYERIGQSVVIHVEERWTTIPVAKFKSGGGDREIIVGAYDINVLGRFLEIGGQYERLNASNSAVIWYRDPRLFNRRLELFLNLWNVDRKQLLYDQGEYEPTPLSSYLMTRRRANIVLEKEWQWWLRTGLLAEYNDDEFSDHEWFQTNQNPPENDQGSRLVDSRVLLSGLSLKLGRLDYNSFLIDGLDWQIRFIRSSAALVSTDAFSIFSSELRCFKTLPHRSTLGLNFAMVSSDTKLIQYHSFLGGLDTIRGFPASRFHASNHWRSNVEFRIPSFDTSWLVVQHVVFGDATSLAPAAEELKFEVSAASVGIGLRLISPRIYRFVGRLDYAFALDGVASEPVSFGVQQFF